MRQAVTIVIPTFNGLPLLQQYLPAVERLLREGDVLLLADDASSDGSLVWLAQRYQTGQAENHGDGPQAFSLYQGSLVTGSRRIPVLLLAGATNVRFARSVNRAMALVTTPYVLLLNNDVEPAPDLLDQLVPQMDRTDVFAVGCHEYESDDQTLEGGKNRLWFARGVFQHARAAEFRTGETAWVSGGSGLFRVAMWRELGGFDERFYPAYWEDTDLSMRAHQRGWQTLFCAEAVVYHHHETSNASVFGQAQLRTTSWQHQQYFTRKHATLMQLIQYYLWKPYWFVKMRGV